ncbi:putative LRR and NB-ARC domains-containing disease resistance protein [Heracleum sosnowskyi]|uniref:LRR and NB-ARC domains-containing disease resistance protein n=1 Tax=Heracleum sosnowskyi TaxID=360622 RepID=A0AAD8HXV1_9APIA|nr:putative LRR and NB-ARC domains-containing disease resistance protein [Heracleum sosnowskyi]
MADIFLSASVTVLFDRLASVDLLCLAKQVQIDDQLKRWKNTLSRIQVVLADAEEKQFTNRSVRLWLVELQHFSYDLDDTLDILETEVLRRLVSGSNSSFSFMNIMSNHDAGSKINDISTRLDNIIKQKDGLDLKENAGLMPLNTTFRRWPSTSLVEAHVYGREKDKEMILDMLLKDDETGCDKFVVPIVGMGGLGKTTLAQLIYNDEKVDKNFQLKAWACVSDNFDIPGVTRAIIESLTSQSCNLNDLNTLQVTLMQKLSGKKFLLVLDDIWNQNYEEWDLLRRPFLVGAPGSKIIVTTRILDVAKMLSHVREHHLTQLGPSHCLSLLARHALGKDNFEEHPDLKEIGEGILKKCKGLPLAVKMLGGLLRTKQFPNQWEDILKSKILDLPEQAGGILPALRLSYHHLLPHLKQCFAFCAIYPKDFEFDKKKLVKLWMAVGLLPKTSRSKQSEDFGCEYFDDLLSRSFFQQSATCESKYVMHDLIHDLAEYVSGERCHKMEDKWDNTDDPQRVRYYSYITQRFNNFDKFKILHKFKSLRTFIRLDMHYGYTTHLSNKVLKHLLPKLKCLRLLSLNGNNIVALPASIGDLKHMRYIDLSWTSIKTLPESVTALYNLQTLLVYGCRYLCKLPVGIGNLISLRHLDNANTRELRETPCGIGKLTNLQTLSKIVVGKGDGLELRELRDLKLLRGKLCITELQNVVGTRDAKEAKLGDKQDLDELILEWGTNFDESRSGNLDFDVLGVLEPQKNLEKLTINYFGGIRLPNWIADPSFMKLHEMSLSGYERCTSLPPLGQLRMLKVLSIQDMPVFRSLGADFSRGEHSSGFVFSSLEKLTFDGMPEWNEWCCFESSEEEGSLQFPCLRELTLRKCPKLIRIPKLQLPSLCILNLEDCPGTSLDSFTNLTALTTLTINSMKELTCLSKEYMQSCGELEYLDIKNCDEMVTLWGAGVALAEFSCLKEMKVESCRRLISFSETGQAFPRNLKFLSILQCENLRSFLDMPSLIKLSIKKCQSLQSFAAVKLPMLQQLDIKDCTALVSMPDYEAGVSSVQEFNVSNCSSLRWWPMDKSPTTLEKLSISKNCRNLEVGTVLQQINSRMSSLLEIEIRDSWGVLGKIVNSEQHRLASLVKLVISNCTHIESFRAPSWPPIPHLKVLCIGSCENLRKFPLNQIQSLESLDISFCPELESFPDGDLPLKLTKLTLRGCGELLKPLSEWGLHRLPSLESFSISGGFSRLISISDNNSQGLLPQSLKQLRIGEFQNLESIAKGLQNCTSLEQLLIWGCPKLRSLPEGNLVSSLLSLEIRDCPVLENQCLPKNEGYYWPIICDIPRVKLAHRYIHDEESSVS